MNVNLWFARNDDKEIISIVNAKQKDDYTCPICGSKVIPKALGSEKITPHFAHIDKEKCNSESMLHWWFKHKFIEQGETFKIKTDKAIEFTCERYDVEKTYSLKSGLYRPDLVITTECGNEIVFEMANSNKKKVQEYIDRWIELGKVVVEIDIKSLMGSEKVFPALFYKGKCFNFNKRDDGYYTSIGKLKEQMVQNGNYDIEKVKKLDWLWAELVKYKQNQISYKELFLYMDALNDYDMLNILKNANCNDLYKRYKYSVGLAHFYEQLPQNHDIRLALKQLNKSEKGLNAKLSRNSEKELTDKWWNGKRVEKVSYYYYYINSKNREHYVDNHMIHLELDDLIKYIHNKLIN